MSLATANSALICPRCGGPLPKQALWRIVNCPFCNSTVTRNTRAVQAQTFHEIHRSALQNIPRGNDSVQVGGVVYRRLFQIGAGDEARVFLGERVSTVTERVVLKIGAAPERTDLFDREIAALTALQASRSADAAYFTTRLPQVIQCGPTTGTPGYNYPVLILRHACGFWGSLDQARSFYPAGVDARHIVWIWRRTLEVLGFVHRQGWSHGGLRPEHLLVHPRDHGILLCGWSRARSDSAVSLAARITVDLRQSAWAMRELMAPLDQEPTGFGAAPAPLVDLLQRVSEDARWCRDQSAGTIEAALRQAALESYGAPQFVEFQV